MMDARVLVAFAALLAFALFYASRGVPSAFAPLCAAASAALWLALFGGFGVLRAGGWLLYALAALAAGWLVFWHAVRKNPLPKLGYGFWFFAAGGLVLIFLLWLRQPMFTNWDEFSFWGTAGKLTKLFDELYVTAPIGWAWTASQKPALIVLGYFFQFLGGGFAEWQSYVAVDVLQLACLACVLVPFDGAAQNVVAAEGVNQGKKITLLPRGNGLSGAWSGAVPVMFAGLLLPFVFQHYETATSASPAWLDALADIPMGFVFAAALCCWFAAPRRGIGALVPVGLAVALLTLTKETGLALGLVVAALVVLDCLFAKGAAAKPRPLKRRALRALLAGGTLAVVVVLCFVGWSAYVSAATGANTVANVGGKAEMSMLQMPLAFLRDLFAPQKSEFFTYITSWMVKFFFISRENMLGSGAVVAAIALGFTALAFFLWKDRGHRRRCAVFAAGSTIGFVLWYLLVIMTYLYLFREEQARSFESSARYVYPYYIAWLLCATALLGMAVVKAAPKRAALGKGVLLVFAAGLLLRTAQLVPANYTVLGVHAEEYNERREFSAHVQRVRAVLEPDGRTYLVNSGDTGIGWFMYCHEMLPGQLDYSFGGGAVEVRETQPDGSTKVTPLTAKELEEYLLESGCTTVYVAFADAEFMETYGALFADGMESYRNGEANLYAVVADGGLHLEPLMWVE